MLAGATLNASTRRAGFANGGGPARAAPMVPFSFAGHALVPLAPGALFWPAERALLVADLHLEKASHFARLGAMLPPYDSQETLARIAALVALTGAGRLFALGDSFHDCDGPARMSEPACRALAELTARLEWTWITGNHDRIDAAPGGSTVAEARLAGVTLRHEADPRDPAPEISGHWHPKLRVVARGRQVARCCFVVTPSKIVLPALGSLTGGLDAGHPSILAAVGRPADALVPLADRILRFPLAA